MRFTAALPLGSLASAANGAEVLRERISTVLETASGSVPWRPDLGWDFDAILGKAATPERIQELKWRVEQAVATALPDVEVAECAVRIVPSDANSLDYRANALPLAETALLSFGANARIDIALAVRAPDGTAVVQSTLEL